MDRICPSPFPILVVAVGASPLPTLLVAPSTRHCVVSEFLGALLHVHAHPCSHLQEKKEDQHGMGHNELTVFRLARLRLGALAVVDVELSMYVVVG